MRDVRGAVFEYRSVLAVCAHPDDESFGLGAVLTALAADGVETRLLCFTHGEASTLGVAGGDLAAVRTAELAAAGAVLGVRSVRLLSHSDGQLAQAQLDDLSHEVDESIVAGAVDCLLVFDEGGITGHADHEQAPAAALASARRRDLPVLAWALADSVTSVLHDEFDAPFVGRPTSAIDFVVDVDRERQHRAIACHASQSSDNPVLRRRLALQGDVETLRWLRAG